jgi:hypothetical protein
MLVEEAEHEGPQVLLLRLEVKECGPPSTITSWCGVSDCKEFAFAPAAR